MATSNLNITSSWSKVAEAGDPNLLVTWETPAVLEFATTAADAAPTVDGHRVSHLEAITRQILGDGYVWARLVAGTVPATIRVVVSK